MNRQLESIINNSKIAVIPTDTVYGIVAKAKKQHAVEKIYKIRERNPSKPCIILISDVSDIKIFKIDPQPYISTLDTYWPGPVSIVLPCNNPELKYLHRGTNSLAFRLPNVEWLRKLLKKTGPLIAPSANIEGNLPAATILEAKNQFGDKVDYYLDIGKVKSKPSVVISLLNDKEEVIRK